MLETFGGYYRPNGNELSELWREATFVFDTNVLLNLYRYPARARDDLIRVLSENRDRVWIPHQVALEYQERRLHVIAEQIKKYDEVRKVVAGTQAKLAGDLAQLQLKRRHSSIDPQPLLTAMSESVEAFLQDLARLEANHPDVFAYDETREKLDAIFVGRVGSPPESQQWLDQLYERGRARYVQKCPPGYKDGEGKKEKEEDSVYTYGGLVFRRRFGDLIVWNEILTHASAASIKNLIFVTDEESEDWWWQVESRGLKTIGPRPELVEEIQRSAGVLRFYMYNSERFLDQANRQLGAEVSKESIDQVREVSVASRPARGAERTRRYAVALEAVRRWLTLHYPRAVFKEDALGTPDLLIYPSGARRPIGVEVKLASHPRDLSRSLESLMHRAHFEVTTNRLEEYRLIVVTDAPQLTDIINRRLERWSMVDPRITAIVGVVEGDGDSAVFVPLSGFAPTLFWNGANEGP